ncbi:MAG: hypothetical protein SPF12_04800 [Prevotella sp.]|nr:hypothetical protein [Prevotella sp.]
MSSTVFINVYKSYVDRGATVNSTPSEHYEVDEEDIKIGKPLPKWRSGVAPIVTAYNEQQIELEYEGKSFLIKVGEEVTVSISGYDVGMGVTVDQYYCVKLIGKKILYIGSWQWPNTIRQELEGPIGQGEVKYPNGDCFKGYFHLSYACINGPAYAAEGRYEFADGSYIEKAWITTDNDYNPDHWGLNGVFRVHHPGGYDSIAMFIRGKRYGFELGLPESKYSNPWVSEWFEGDEIIRYSGPNEREKIEVTDYEIDETSKKGCMTLRLTLGNGCRVEQQGGRYETNQYDNDIYHPDTHSIIHLPNGDILDHNGSCVREYKPYDGYVNVFSATKGKSRIEHWEKGKMKSHEDWKYDRCFINSVELPNPTGADGTMTAYVWKDGHIEYKNKEWVYDGEVSCNRPHGKGVLQGDAYHQNRRLEGEFANGVYVSDEKNLDGEITLHVKSGHSNGGPWEYEEKDIVARRGTLKIDGFWNYEITSIKSDCITIEFYKEKYEVRPGKPLLLYKEIEGREWSDGCVYESDEYNLELTWVD